MAAGCGEDKGYGDPIDSPAAEQSAQAAVDSSFQIHGETNDAAVVALSGMSSNVSVLVNAKLQAQYQEQLPEQPTATSGIRAGVVDELCVDISDTEIVYDDCDFQGGSLAGTVNLGDDSASVDISISVSADAEYQIDTRMRGDITVTDSRVVGALDYDVTTVSDDVTSDVELSTTFDVDVVDGCAVGGEIEANADQVARTGSVTASQSIWVKATFGPECGDVVIR